MTHREKVIVSAYTGILMCDFSDVHEYIEKILGRPVWTHELADKKIQDEIKAASKSDFLTICETEEGHVPPHGRLIDVDKVLGEFAHNLGIRSLDYLTPSERAIVSWFRDAPTVIPAAHEEEKMK